MTQSLKIIQTTAHFQPEEYGGFEHYLCRGISELGHEPLLITSDRRAPRYSKDRSSLGTGEYKTKDYRIYRFPTLFDIRSVPIVDLDIIEFLSDIDFDVVHAHEIYEQITLMAFYVARKKRIPFGFTQHRNYCPQGVLGSSLRLFYQSIGRKVVDACNFICATSNSAADFLRNLGITRDIEILPNCLDTNVFRPDIETDLKEEMGLQGNKLILFVGRLHKEKGLKYLIEAFKTIKNRCPKTKLILAGKGEERENLESRISELGLHGDVVFLDYFPYKKMPELYNACDIVVLPSIFEPFGMVLVEAMACGKPIVGSKVGGIKDIIEDGENGFLTQPRNTQQLAGKIEILLFNEDLRTKFGRKGREKSIENFSYKAVAKKALNIYKRLLRTQ